MKASKIHTYKGCKILPLPVASTTARPDDSNLRWYIQSIHDQTGIPYGWENSKLVHSLREAREYINETRKAGFKSYS